MGRAARRGIAGDRWRALRRRARLGRRDAGHQENPERAGRLMAGITLDAGGLIALDRSDRRIVVLLARARATHARVTVPATALAQAVRRPEQQVRLPRLPSPPTPNALALLPGDATE